MKLNQCIVEHAVLARTFKRQLMIRHRCHRGIHAGLVLAAKSKNPIDKNRLDSIASGNNAVYIEKIFSKWDKDPSSVNSVSV